MNDILDFSVRSNPVGMPEKIRSVLTDAVLCGLDGRADRNCTDIRSLIARRHGASLTQIAVCDNEEELCALLVRTSGARRALLPVPCPEFYERALLAAKIDIKKLKLSHIRSFRFAEGELRTALEGCDLLLMGNPAFPSSALLPPNALISEIDDWISAGGTLLLDESAVDFTYGSVVNSLWSAVRREGRAAILRSFTNYFAINQLPLCYAVGGSGWISEARAVQTPPALCGLTQSLKEALEVLMPFRTQTADFIIEMMPKFVGRLRRISGLKTFPCDANWVLCRLERSDMTTEQFAQALLAQGIMIQPCIDGSYFTLALKKEAETDRFIKTARSILMPRPQTPKASKYL
ncbi:MAG: hypothetical protein SOZ52_06315 [Pyramidobacter sp.]|nr:hypothetical protein [Pyramidobacter sp.]